MSIARDVERMAAAHDGHPGEQVVKVGDEEPWLELAATARPPSPGSGPSAAASPRNRQPYLRVKVFTRAT
jgi:hypothetical protein